MINNHKIKPKKEKIPFYIKNFKAIVFLIILIITIPAYYFLVKPQYNVYRVNQKKISQLEKQRQLNVQQLLTNKKIVNEYKAINELDKNKINQILPQKPDLANLYVNLEAVVNQAGLVLENMTVEPVKITKKKVAFADDPKIKKNNQLGVININLAVSDVSYAKLKNFFNILERNIRLFDINSFNFMPAEGNLALNLKTYYLLGK